MARDAVANVVMRLMNCGYEPRKVGDDAWESRCPAHRSVDHALAISRNAFDHVILECRSNHNCTHSRIVTALGLTNEHVYAETPEGWIRRLGLVPVQSAAPSVTGPSREVDGGAGAGEMASGSAGSETVPAERRVSTDAGAGGAAGAIITEIERHEEVRQGDVAVVDAGDPPPHPDPLPVGARAISELHCTTQREGQAGFLNTCTELLPSVDERAEGGFENPANGSIGIHFSSISVSVNRDDKMERPSVVQALSRIASNAQLFRAADGRFCAGSRGRSARDFWAPVGGVSRLAD